MLPQRDSTSSGAANRRAEPMVQGVQPSAVERAPGVDVQLRPAVKGVESIGPPVCRANRTRAAGVLGSLLAASLGILSSRPSSTASVPEGLEYRRGPACAYGRCWCMRRGHLGVFSCRRRPRCRRRGGCDRGCPIDTSAPGIFGCGAARPFFRGRWATPFGLMFRVVVASGARDTNTS